MSRLPHLFRALLPALAAAPHPDRHTGWQSLREPIAGYSIVDGVPVAVVAMQRNSATGQLEVVRGRHPSPEGSAGAPLDAKRHVVPALSFNPHPRRELTIGGQKFYLGSVPSSVRCVGCASVDNGFSFVGASARGPAAGEDPGEIRAFCAQCAEKLARLAGAEA